jgi:hypothetical protein
MVRDARIDPITRQYVHLDFIRVMKGQRLKVQVPIVLEGESEGVKVGGFLGRLKAQGLAAAPRLRWVNPPIRSRRIEGPYRLSSVGPRSTIVIRFRRSHPKVPLCANTFPHLASYSV